MRTAFCIAFGLAVVAGGVPAAFAQDSGVPDHGKSAGTGAGAEERRAQQGAGSNKGISLEVPIGRVSVDPGLDGEPVYVRRTTVREGLTVVEVSTTPFMPVLPSNQVAQLVVRTDQPAPW